jgi:predicted aspartyl protease
MTQKHQPADDWIILPGTTIGGEVGTFRVDFTIRNRITGQARSLNGLVDTGASYTVIPEIILDELSIERDDLELFSLADGSVQELAIGRAEMELQGRTRDVYVVFGTDRRKILLGAMALEAFALAADAKYHRLIRAELTL